MSFDASTEQGLLVIAPCIEFAYARASIFNKAAGTGIVVITAADGSLSMTLDGQVGDYVVVAISRELRSRSWCFVLDDGALAPDVCAL